MAYGNRSIKYFLPSPIDGDILQASEEKKKVDIIDSNLGIALQLITDGSGCGIIEEGQYSSSFVSDNSTVYLSELKPTAAVKALIDNIYVQSFNQLFWTGLLNNQTYYLFLSLVENTGLQSSRQYAATVTTSSTISTVPLNSVLVATAVISGSAITLNTNPTGKKYITFAQSHITDTSDPHGSTLTQTTLNVGTLNVTGDVVFDSGISGNVVFHSGVVIEKNLKVYKGIDANNYKITSLLPPDDDTDATNKAWVENYVLASGSTGGSGNSGIDISKEGEAVILDAFKLTFSGIGVAVTDLGSGEVLVDIPGSTSSGDGSGTAVRKVVTFYTSLVLDASYSGNIHLEVLAFDNTDESDAVTKDSYVSQTDFKIFDGTNYTAFPSDGMPSIFEAGCYVGSDVLTKTYVKWRIKDKDNNIISDWVAGELAFGNFNNLKIYDVADSVFGLPGAGATVMRFEAVRNFIFPQQMVGSRASADIAARASASFLVKKNNATISTFTFASGFTTATFSDPVVDEAIVPGDIIKVIAPASQDASLDTISWTLKGEV